MTLRLHILLACVAGFAACAGPVSAARGPAALHLVLAKEGAPQPPDDFELLPPEQPPDEAALARQEELSRGLARRSQLLRLHQAAGFATVATMAATVVLGQLNYADKYGGGGDTGRYRGAHRLFAYGTSGVFAATGLLALLAPSPFEKPLRWDTATLHRASMIVATAGMVAQVVLGVATSKREGRVSQRDFALAHQIVGYGTLAATSAGFFVLAFP